MPLIAVSLILTSSVLHAVWNLLLKRAENKLAFTAIYVAVAPICLTPYLIAVPSWRLIPPTGWVCITTAALLYAAYYEGLARAYRLGELSVVYPVARGVGPALALVFGVLWLGETPTVLGLLGVALIIGSVYIMHRRAVHFEANHSGRVAALWLAVFVGTTYSLYSLVDKVGVSRFGIEPLTYIALSFSLAALLVFARVAWLEGVPAIAGEWRMNAGLCSVVSALNLSSYLLVLLALRMPEVPVGYVVPLRATSSLFGVLFGARLLREGGLFGKLLAAAVIVTGVVLISWKG